MSFDLGKLMVPADINDPGVPGSLQRLLYSATRCTTHNHWRDLNMQANSLLEHYVRVLSKNKENKDTELTILLNALVTLTEAVLRLGEGIMDTRESLKRILGNIP
jgi:hypothetical protein